MKTIILAGGFGTRLRSITGDEIPKCMVKGWFKPGHREIPWMEIVVRNLKSQGITDITLALHYKAEVFTEWFGDKLKYKIEEMPLGTGGAIKNCIEGEEPVLVLNGDTYAKCDYNDMLNHHNKQKVSPITIAKTKDGTNAGVYIMEVGFLKNFSMYKNGKIEDKVFSLEDDVLHNWDKHSEFCSNYYIECFTDMGTPTGYKEALE